MPPENHSRVQRPAAGRMRPSANGAESAFVHFAHFMLFHCSTVSRPPVRLVCDFPQNRPPPTFFRPVLPPNCNCKYRERMAGLATRKRLPGTN